MYDFTRQVVMVTGGTGNLGRATVLAFADAGARVVIVDRDTERQKKLYADWVENDRYLLMAPFDVTSPTDVSRLVAECVDKTGAIDVLVNTVGAYRGGNPIQQTDPETWDVLMELNARSVFLLARETIPQMLEQGHGKIVNVAARAGQLGTSGQAAYAASKAAVISLTESMSAELRRKGINVNCILPGTIDTPENRKAMPDANAGRWVAPESLASVILFLASDAARDVHGAALPVYGQS